MNEEQEKKVGTETEKPSTELTKPSMNMEKPSTKLAVTTLSKYREILQRGKRAEGDYRWYLERAEPLEPGLEKTMYQDMAEAALEEFKLCRRWKWIVDMDMERMESEKARCVLQKNLVEGVAANAIVADEKGGFLSRAMVTRYKKRGLDELSNLLYADKEELKLCEGKIAQMSHK